MSDTCPKCGVKVSVVGGWLGPIMSHEPNDATCLRNQNAQLREHKAAKAEAERPMTNDYAYHSLASQVEYAINLLDGNEDESDSPGGELVEKLIDHLNHYEAVKSQLAKAEAEAKRYREAWASVRKQWDNEATIAEGWNVPSGDRLASLLRQCIDDMNDLIPPAEQ